MKSSELIGGQRPYYLKDLSGKEGLYEIGKRQYCDVFFKVKASFLGVRS